MHTLLLLALAGTSSAQDAAAPKPIAEAADEAVSLITDAEWDAAKVLLEQNIQHLGDVTEPVAPADLATLWQALGAAGVWSGDTASVGPAMTQACAVAPGVFNERLGTRVSGYWKQACAELDAKQKGTLEVLGLPAGSTLWVDGVERESASMQLPPGQHLVQAVLEGHDPFAEMVSLTPGQFQSVSTGLVIQPELVEEPESEQTAPEPEPEPKPEPATELTQVPPPSDPLPVTAPEPARTGGIAKPLLLGGTVLSVGAAAGLTVVGLQRLDSASSARSACEEQDATCTSDTETATAELESEGKLMLGGAGVATAAALGLGVTLVIRW